MQASFKRQFAKFVKKAHKPLQLAIEDSVELICSNPDIGENKVGDLSGILVYKFRFNRQEYLIAYRPLDSPTGKPIAHVDILVIDF